MPNSNSFWARMREGPTVAQNAMNPAHSPAFSFTRLVNPAFGNAGMRAGQGMDMAWGYGVQQGWLPQMYNAGGMGGGQILRAAQQNLAFQQMMEYNNRLSTHTMTRGLMQSTGMSQPVASAVSPLLHMFGLQDMLMPGGSLGQEGMASLARVGAMGGVLSVNRGEGMVDAFNAYFGFEPGRTPIARRTSGMSRDQLAGLVELASTRQGSRGIQRIQAQARERYGDAGVEAIRAVTGELTTDERTAFNESLSLTPDNPIAAVNRMVKEKKITPDRGAEITGSLGSGLRERLGGASSLEEFTLGSVLDSGRVEDLSRAMEDLGEGAIDFINTLDNIFGRNATMQPAQLRTLARQLRDVSDATGVAMGELQNVVVMANQQAQMFGGRRLTMQESGRVATGYGVAARYTDDLSGATQRTVQSIMAEADIAVSSGPWGQALDTVMASGNAGAISRLQRMSPAARHRALMGLVRGENTLGLSADQVESVRLGGSDSGARGGASRALASWRRSNLEERARGGDQSAREALALEGALRRDGIVGMASERLSSTEYSDVTGLSRGLLGALGVEGEIDDATAIGMTGVIMSAQAAGASVQEAIIAGVRFTGHDISREALDGDRGAAALDFLQQGGRFTNMAERFTSTRYRDIALMGTANLSREAAIREAPRLRLQAAERELAILNRGYSPFVEALQKGTSLWEELFDDDGNVSATKIASFFGEKVIGGNEIAFQAVLSTLAANPEVASGAKQSFIDAAMHQNKIRLLGDDIARLGGLGQDTSGLEKRRDALLAQRGDVVAKLRSTLTGVEGADGLTEDAIMSAVTALANQMRVRGEADAKERVTRLVGTLRLEGKTAEIDAQGKDDTPGTGPNSNQEETDQ